MRHIDIPVLHHLLTSQDQVGQVALFLGAGCSASAGVPLAGKVALQAKKEIFAAHNEHSEASQEEMNAWFAMKGMFLDSDNEYSEALERLRITPRLRRIYLEGLLAGRRPSPAHWVLANIVRQGLVTTILTTNFDRLLEDSVGTLSTLRVVTHEDMAGDFDRRDGRPTLIKLHGDFLFDHMANTEKELQGLGARQASLLTEICRTQGLVVVGFAGRDNSIMSVFEDSADVGFPLGMYWLSRHGDPISRRVETLLDNCANSAFGLIGGFDEFVTTWGEFVARGRPRRQRSTFGQDFFIADAAGVGRVVTEIREALVDPFTRIVCVTGLPGVGKSATALHVLSLVQEHYSATVYLSGKTRQYSAQDVVDECNIQLGVRHSRGPGSGGLAESMARAAGDRTVLILFDNVDGANAEVLQLLDSVPQNVRVLATLRDARDLRSACPHAWEIEHVGLMDSEMLDFVDHWNRRNPQLRRKLEAATKEDLEGLLRSANGWPEAMVMLLSLLGNTIRNVGDLDGEARDGVYDILLGGLYVGLNADTRRCLNTTGAFPSTFTVEGIQAVSGMSRARTETSLSGLTSCHLVRELRPGLFSWAHPTIHSFVRRKATGAAAERRISAAQVYLRKFVDEYGGQPSADWSNFGQLDTEFENLRQSIESSLLRRAGSVVTGLFRSLFSYIVERGYWAYTDACCTRALELDLANDERADWLVWSSWIKLYLYRDFERAANLAEEAISLHPTEPRITFEAHRRALLASSKQFNDGRVLELLDTVAAIAAENWSANSDQGLDSHNTIGRALLHLGSRNGDIALLDRAANHFNAAIRLSESRDDPNTREIGVARLGSAECLAARGEMEAALESAQIAAEYSWSLKWLRGAAEANELIADLATRLGYDQLSASAAAVSGSLRRYLSAPWQPAVA